MPKSYSSAKIKTIQMLKSADHQVANKIVELARKSPSSLELVAKARSLAERMLQVAAEIAENEEANPNARLKAVEIILQRGYGAAASVHIDDDDSADNMSDEELRAAAKQISGRLNKPPEVIIESEIKR
jgi:hypothetical protein